MKKLLTDEERRAHKRAYYLKNRERLLASCRRYYENHREQHLESARQWRARNRDRVNAYARKYAKENPEKAKARSLRYRNRDKKRFAALKKNANLRRKYNITLEEWGRIFERQRNNCAICRALTSGSRADWHTDHCHKTGRVRGILCNSCNSLLGHARDDPDTLIAAANYLAESSGLRRQYTWLPTDREYTVVYGGQRGGGMTDLRCIIPADWVRAAVKATHA